MIFSKTKIALLALGLMSSQCVLAQDPSDDLKNIVVRPATLSFNLAPGQTFMRKVSIANRTDKKIQFEAYLNDWLRDSIGGHQYFSADTLPISCASWVELDNKFIEIEPGQTRELSVKLTAPTDSASFASMKWAMVFIESISEKISPDAKGAVVSNKMRIGVHVYQTPPDLNNKEVQLLRFTAMTDSVNQYKLVCKNTGQVQLECKTYLELSALGKDLKRKVDGRVFPIFPGQERLSVFTLPADLPKGKYNVVAAVDGGDDIALDAVQTEIEVK